MTLNQCLTDIQKLLGRAGSYRPTKQFWKLFFAESTIKPPKSFDWDSSLFVADLAGHCQPRVRKFYRLKIEENRTEVIIHFGSADFCWAILLLFHIIAILEPDIMALKLNQLNMVNGVRLLELGSMPLEATNQFIVTMPLEDRVGHTHLYATMFYYIDSTQHDGFYGDLEIKRWARIASGHELETNVKIDGGGGSN